MKKSLRASLMLLLTAFIWGVAFVAQDVAMDSVQPFTFNGARMVLATAVVFVFSLVWDKLAAKNSTQDFETTGAGVPFSQMTKAQRRVLCLGGVCCGAILALASSLQQIGIQQGASAGKAGFVTALYIVLVPVCGLFLGKKLRPVILLAVALSVAGLYLLCITGGFEISPSDVYLILCALAFSGHILAVDHFSRRTDCVKMSCLQFLVTAVLCLLMAFIFEKPDWQSLRACAVPLLYAGVLSGGAGYTLQIVAQKDTDPTVASLIMCLESVFAVLAGWLILGDQMTAREYLGCFLMLCGILTAQWPDKKPLGA